MKFRPLHDRVVIERIDAEAKTAGGIIIPDTAQEKPQQGRVIAVLAPVCADKFRALPDVAARTATLVADKDNSYKMREAFPEALITLPGKTYPDSDLTAACAGLVLAPPKTANLKQ